MALTNSVKSKVDSRWKAAETLQVYRSLTVNGIATLVLGEENHQIQVTKLSVSFEDDTGASYFGAAPVVDSPQFCSFDFRSSVIANVNDIFHVVLSMFQSTFGENAPPGKCLYACNVGEALCVNLRCMLAPFEATIYIQYKQIEIPE